MPITVTPLNSSEAAVTSISGVGVVEVPVTVNGYTVTTINTDAVSGVSVLVLPNTISILQNNSLTGVSVVYFLGVVPQVQGTPFGTTSPRVYSYLGSSGWPASGALWSGAIVGKMGLVGNTSIVGTPVSNYESSEDLVLYTGGGVFGGTQDQILVVSVEDNYTAPDEIVDTISVAVSASGGFNEKYGEVSISVNPSGVLDGSLTYLGLETLVSGELV